MKNGAESDVDCGGAVCPACDNGATCVVESDCASGGCSGGACGPWSLRAGGVWNDDAFAVAADVAGNVFFAGDFAGASSFGGPVLTSVGDTADVFIAKYDRTGAHLWSKRFGGGGIEVATALATDGAGNVVVAGRFGERHRFRRRHLDERGAG